MPPLGLVLLVVGILLLIFTSLHVLAWILIIVGGGLLALGVLLSVLVLHKMRKMWKLF